MANKTSNRTNYKANCKENFYREPLSYLSRHENKNRCHCGSSNAKGKTSRSEHV